MLCKVSLAHCGKEIIKICEDRLFRRHFPRGQSNVRAPESIITACNFRSQRCWVSPIDTAYPIGPVVVSDEADRLANFTLASAAITFAAKEAYTFGDRRIGKLMQIADFRNAAKMIPVHS